MLAIEHGIEIPRLQVWILPGPPKK